VATAAFTMSYMHEGPPLKRLVDCSPHMLCRHHLWGRCRPYHLRGGVAHTPTWDKLSHRHAEKSADPVPCSAMRRTTNLMLLCLHPFLYFILF
jgi:hypothetical protein